MSTLDSYLDDLNALLVIKKKKKIRIMNEIRDHLLDSVEVRISLGTPDAQAEKDAVKAFGSVQIIADGFNAGAGAKAARQAPKIALMTVVLILTTFLVAAWSQPRNTSSASVFQQVTFFLSIISAQLALTAGLCGGSRALALWGSLESSAVDRAFIKRALKISLISLEVGVAAITSNFLFDSHRNKSSYALTLIPAISLMITGSTFGLISLSRLRINDTVEIQMDCRIDSPKILSVGEGVIREVKQHPIISLLPVAFIAGISAMNKAETNSLQQALPWGISEVMAVVLGFYFLGPVLGLRKVGKKFPAFN